MKLIEKVMHLLNEDERTRDNDDLLIARIWYREMPKDIDAITFLKMYAEGKFTTAESIRRCRQKLQEETPGLRGKKWVQRHNTNHEFIYEL